MNRTFHFFSYFFLLLLFLGTGCTPTPAAEEKDIVEAPEKMDLRVTAQIEKALNTAISNEGKLSDTILLRLDTAVLNYYQGRDFKRFWSSEERFNPLADSLLLFVRNSKEYGLFPSDYHHRSLSGMFELLQRDSLSRKDAVIWSKADILLTDAAMLIGKHLKQGRLKYDSVTLRTDSILPGKFFQEVMSGIHKQQNLRSVFQELEPKYRGYDSLKIGLKWFLDSIKTFRKFTYLEYPSKDSAAFYTLLEKRVKEEGLWPDSLPIVDTASWRSVFTKFQKQRGLKVTGRINENTVLALNFTPWERFKQIAVNLDRYKHLPDTLPSRFIWVNIPAYYMEVWESDSMVLLSRVVVGKPLTRTPLLTSKITDMITYPQWTIPTSIIEKEVLPGVKKDPAYFEKHGYSLVDSKGAEVDPYTVKWKNYTKGIPYKVVQGSGDANALGVLKFNFSNKYSVYMHDTNQRYLFSNAARSLSHGCVRVQEWEKLAMYILRYDSANRKSNEGRYAAIDSLKAWMSRKEKHYLPVRNRMPVYIRYFSVVGKNGRLRFYEDIYGEDRKLRERYFADKSIQ